MANTKKTKTSKEKKVLIASLVVAAVMVGGSTFAWFTSKDEVTNRLSAKAEYNTSIVEDFTPPQDWLPGQEINKDVSIVNTGNIDALVGIQLSGKYTVINAGTGAAVESNATALPSGVTTAANLDAVSALNTAYALELSSKSAAATPATETSNAVDGIANEVTTLQAGGTLIWKAGAPVTPLDASSVRSGDDATAADYSGENQFKPDASGVYIFRRNVKTDASGAETYKYSGYLFIKGATAADDKYYAFETETATLTDGSENATTPFIKDINVTYAADGTVSTVSGLKLATVEKSETNAVITYDIANNKAVATNGAGGKIAINIGLANVGTEATNPWQYVDGKGFFYTDDLEEGGTTAKLVDSVTLDSSVTNGSYLAMDFDLSVAHESVQVTKDSSGNEAVPGGAKLFGATPSATADSELSNVSWQ